jgi:hypothetical protein
MVVNTYGRPWAELDSLRALVTTPGAFSLVSRDGVPLVGRHVRGEVPVRLVATEWGVDAHA